MLINAGQDNKTRYSRLHLHVNNMIMQLPRQDVIRRVNFSFPKLHMHSKDYSQYPMQCAGTPFH